MQNRKTFVAITSVLVATLAAYLGGFSQNPSQGHSLLPGQVNASEEAMEVSPTRARGDRDVYYPNTEDLHPDEMRVIACGTGMPTTRAAQAAACFLVELGNGDKFLFDIGSGSAERISSLQIPYNYPWMLYLL